MGAELFAVQMMPVDIIKKAIEHGVTDRTMADLAGNAFTGTVFFAVALAALVHYPIPTEEKVQPVNVMHILGL